MLQAESETPLALAAAFSGRRSDAANYECGRTLWRTAADRAQVFMSIRPIRKTFRTGTLSTLEKEPLSASD
jgi:hypothetical protein